MMVERRWPTCISLARFGEDRSITTRCAGPAFAHAETFVGEGAVEAGGEPDVILEEVEEAGAGDLHLGQLLVGGDCLDQPGGQVARLHPGRLGQHHGDVAGEIAVATVLGVLHLDVRGQAGG